MQHGADFSGWGSKQGSKVKTWKKRFFVLRERELVYYSGSSSGSGSDEKGRLTVVGADFAPELKHGLLIRGEKKRKVQVLKMKTATADESKAWLLKLREAVAATDPSGGAHLSASFRSRSVSGSTASTSTSTSSSIRNFLTPASRALSSQASYHSQRSLSEPRAAPAAVTSSSSGEYYTNSSDEKRGWLLKEGSKVKSWKKRFFVLRGNVLTYYEDERSSPKLGALVVRDVETNFLTPFTLDVHAEGGRLLRIAADSLQDIESWDLALTQAIEKAASGGQEAKKPIPLAVLQSTTTSTPSLKSFDSFRDYDKIHFRAQDSRLFDDDDEVSTEPSFATNFENADRHPTSSSSSSYASQMRGTTSSGSNFTTCEGWLLKQGRVSKQWKRRYFSLSNDLLEYRHTPEDFPNEDEVVVDAHFDNHDDQQRDCLHIELDSGRTITVAAESQLEFEKWARVFSELTGKPFKPELPEKEEELYAEAYEAKSYNNGSVMEAHAIDAEYADEAYDVSQHMVVAEPVVKVADVVAEPEIKYGWLLKQGSLIKSWKRRYFMLEGDSLQYFDNIDKPARGGGIVARVLRDGDNKSAAVAVGENCLDVHLASGRILKVSTESPSELSSWYNALLNASRLLPTVTPTADNEFDNNNNAAPRLQKKMVQEGWLLKKGQNFKNWKQRYFVLERSRLVYYASDAKDGDLLGSGVVFEVAVGDARPLCVDIRFQNGRLLQVVAPDQLQFEVWLHALQNASNLTESFLSQHDEDTGNNNNNISNAVFDDEFDLDFGDDDGGDDGLDWTSNQAEHEAADEDKGGYSTWAAAMDNKPEWDRSDSYGSSISDEDDKQTAEPLTPTPDDAGRASDMLTSGGCSGWLNKEGGTIKTWKRRYFSLHGTMLRYFKSESGKLLSSYTITRVDERPALPLGLEVTTTTDRTLVLTAESKEDFAKWLSSLQDALRAAGADDKKTPLESVRLSVPTLTPAIKPPVAKPSTPVNRTSAPVLSLAADVRRASTVSATVNLEGKTVTSYSGWLEKEGQRFRTWKRRYFTYKKGALLYFNEVGGVAHGHGVVTAVRVDATKAFTLSITLENERELRVSADSAEEMGTWLHVLSSDIPLAPPRKSEQGSEGLGRSSVASSTQSQGPNAGAVVGRGEARERISDRLDPNDYLTNDTISNESFLRIQEGQQQPTDASAVQVSFNTGRPFKGDLDFTASVETHAKGSKAGDEDHKESNQAGRLDSEEDLEYYRSLLAESEIEREKREAEKDANGVNGCAPCCVVM